MLQSKVDEIKRRNKERAENHLAVKSKLRIIIDKNYNARMKDSGIAKIGVCDTSELIDQKLR